MKNAILLAGGLGTRLLPFTKITSKHLLNVNGKCIIDYPIETLKQSGVQNLTIVVGSSFSGQILDYIQDGSRYGLNVNYRYQQNPLGIAQAINICKNLVSSDENFQVILGDNIFTKPIKFDDAFNGAQIVLHKHPELQRFGVASLQNNKIIKIEEKPVQLNECYDNYAISGCYVFDQQFFEFFKELAPSKRGEFEITDIIRNYHSVGRLEKVFYENALWSDVGTHESIAFVNNYLYNI